jgi:predicted Zn-dependent protease with MMP-like domain
MEPDPIRQAFDRWWIENTGKRLRTQQMLKEEAFGVYRDAMREAVRQAARVADSMVAHATAEEIRKHFGVEGEKP